MSIQSTLANFVVTPPASLSTPEVTRAAKLAIVDAVGAILAGSTSTLADAMIDFGTSQSVPGPHRVLGTDLSLTAERAALVNATFGHSMDFDDTVSLMPGHPGTVLVSAIMSALDGSPSGRDIVRSFVVGYEVATKLGAAIGMGHYNRGWHSTGSIGVFGAFAAVAHLRRLSRVVVGNGLGIVSSLASGLRINFGTMTKPLHSGWAASSGVVAAQLAESGFTGHRAAMDGEEGFFATYGTPASRPGLLAELLAQAPILVAPGIALKKYPCCYALHRAIDGLEDIRREARFDAEAVVRVEARVPPGALKPVPYERPDTGFEGRFSMPYILAVGALDGDFGMDAFTDDAVARPGIRALLDRVSAREDPACSPDDPEGLQRSAGTRGHVYVRVELDDGRVLERVVDTPPGSPSRPLSEDEITAKFRACAHRAGLDQSYVDQALRTLLGMEEVEDSAHIVNTIATASGLPARRRVG